MSRRRPIRVLLVDDSAFARQTLTRIIASVDGVEVVGKAWDGMDALQKIHKLTPDLVITDLEMPKMDGFGLLRWMRENGPIPTIVVSSLADPEAVFRAMTLGAIDLIRKPVAGAKPELQQIEGDLRRFLLDFSRHGGSLSARRRPRKSVPGEKKDRTIRARQLSEPAPRPSEKRAPRPRQKPLLKRRVAPELVVIGASTGGPTALERIIAPLPWSFPIPVIVVQHMPAGFTALFAKRLNSLAALTVVEAADGLAPVAGSVYVCPGGYHTLVTKRRRLAVIASEPDDRYVPSVDKTMQSASAAIGDRLVGVLLTGMGDDGRIGMTEIDASLGMTIAESEESCLVYGMPERAVSAGVVDRVLPVDGILAELRALCR